MPTQPQVPARRIALPTGPWMEAIAVLVAVGVLFGFALALEKVLKPMPGWAFDFVAYYDAARRLATEGTPYQVETLGGPFFPGPAGLYLYPPVLAFLLQPLATLSLDAATFIWLAFRVSALTIACLLMPVPMRTRIAVTVIGAGITLPVIADLRLGNVSLLVTCLAVVAWRWMDRPAASIALAVSLVLRATMGVFLAWWVIRGRFRQVFWTLLTAFGIVAATLPVIGVDPWIDYLVVLRNLSDVTGVPNNIDFGSFVHWMDGPEWAQSLALFAGYGAAVGAILVSLRYDRELSFVVTAGATMLLAPLLWDHYLTLVLIPAAFLAGRGRPRWGLVLLLLASLLPQPFLPFAALAAVVLPFLVREPYLDEPAGSIVGWVRQRRARSRSEAPSLVATGIHRQSSRSGQPFAGATDPGEIA